MWRAMFSWTVLAVFAGLLLTGCGEPAQTTETKQAVEPSEAAPAAQSTPETPAPARAVPAGPILYRDTWGVPHIYADSEAEAAYALGYAQAQDRLDDIYKNVRTAIGSMAEFFGPEHAETDYIMRVIKNAERCEAYWDSAPENVKTLCDQFMAGIEAYVAEHPEERPEFALELEGWQSLAIMRTMIMRWPLGTIMDDFKNKGDKPPFASNEWAVAPERSADGCAILLTDPHLTWEGMAVFYETRVHAPDLEMDGFCLVGVPLIVLGHNGKVGWGCTTGGPDTSDVYALKVRMEGGAPQYEYDGEWKNAEMGMITFPVKGADDFSQPVAYTEKGFLLEMPDMEKGVAYVGATPYLEEVALMEQIYAMNKADTTEEFFSALAMNQLMEQNLMFADTRGVVQYVRVGRTPIRPEGYNWSAPVPGNTSDTAWQGIHPLDDMVQIKNPPQGYMQNCNISPENMMLDSPLTPDKYIDYIYNVSWDDTNPRSERLLEVLPQDDSITQEEAKDLAMDITDPLSKVWQGCLKTAVDAAGAQFMKDADFAKVVERILAWDGRYTADSQAAPIVKFWRLKLPKDPFQKVVKGESLNADEQTKLLAFLADTVAEFKERHGGIDVTWGDLHKVGRSGQYFGCPGADFGGNAKGWNMTETLFDVRTEEKPSEEGFYIARNGSMSMMLMFLGEDGVDAYSCVAWGQSGDPDSPHHVDQAEKLYSQRTLKPTWFTKEELLEHVKGEPEVLTLQ